MGLGCLSTFEHEAEKYDDLLYLLPYYDKVIDGILTCIDFPEDAYIRVLDLGCGTGTLIKKIIEKYLNVSVYAVDFSSAMLSVARSKIGEYSHVRFIEENIFDIDENKYPYFDLIISTFVLHNYENEESYEVIFNKIINLLSVGGKFILGDIIQCEGIEEQDYERAFQIEKMKENHLSDEEITNWFEILDDEDSPLSVQQIEKNLNLSGFSSIITKKIGSTAVFTASRSLDLLQVKSELLISGIKENEPIAKIFELQNPDTVPKTGNNGVFLTLNNSLQVLVSFLHEKNQVSPYSVVEEAGSLRLTKHHKKLDVCVSEMKFPAWYSVSVQVNGEQQFFPSFFVLEGDQYLHLAYKCCDFSREERCTFCSVMRRDVVTPEWMDNDAEMICSVLEEMFSRNYIPPNFHFCLGGGTYLPLSDNVEFFSKIISCIRKHRSKEKGENPIWVEMIPPSKEGIQTLIDCGASSFGFNIEVFDDTLRQKFCPGKSKAAPIEQYSEAFEMVNSSLGYSKIGSCIIVGLDNQDNLKAGIDTLIDHHVFPCVLPLKIFDGTDMKLDETALTLLERDFTVLSHYAADRVQAKGIDVSQNEGCMRCPCCTIIHDML